MISVINMKLQTKGAWCCTRNRETKDARAKQKQGPRPETEEMPGETQRNSAKAGETGPASRRRPHRLRAMGCTIEFRVIHVHMPNQKHLHRRRQQGGPDGDRAEGGVGASGLSISLVRYNGTHYSLLADLSAECGHGIR